MDIKGLLDQGTARLQGEVGRFLILKETIMKLPDGPTRTSLLAKQNELEGKTMDILSRANAFKESASFKGIDALKMFDPARVKAITAIGSEAARAISDIQNHKTAVASASSKYTSPDASGTPAAQAGAFSVPPMLKLALGVAAVAFGVNWVRREARRRTR